MAGPDATSPARARRLALFALVAAAVVALDQLSKAAARSALVPGEPVTLVPGVMDLSLVYNTGAAFSLGEGGGPLFVLLAAAILVAGLVVAWRRADVPLPLVLTVAAVADFFKTTFVDFAVFNVADIFVTCGVVLAVVLYWRWDLARERA